MQLKDRQKMCAQCEGRIPFNAEVCPYCAADQVKISAPSIREGYATSLQESLTAPSAPFKTAKVIPTLNPIKPVNEPMLEKKMNSHSTSPLGIPTIPSPAAEEMGEKEGKSAFLPILLFSVGGNLLTIGLLQFLFSEKGFLRLEWDSHYWFLYCLAALPLFFLGFKKAKGLKD